MACLPCVAKTTHFSGFVSYLVGGRFNAAQFYAEVEGHPDHRNVRLALEELDFFTREVRILRVFPQHPYRLQAGGEVEE